MRRLLAIVAGSFLVFAACDRAEDLAADTSLGFRGEVLRAAAIESAAEESEVEPGVMQLRDVEQTGDGDEDVLDECADAGNDESFTVFWTEETEFDPGSVPEDAGFPANLVGKTVTIDAETPGVDFKGAEDEDAEETAEADERDEEGECVLIAERVSVRDAQAATATPTTQGTVRTPTPTPSPTHTATPTPTVTASPSPTPTVGLPEETP